MFKNMYFLMIALISIVGIGCSGGTNLSHDALTPDVSLGASSLPLGVSDWISDGTPAQGMGVLGLFEINVDVNNQAADLISLRNSALTDVLEVVDITNFLKMGPCFDCVKLQSIGIDVDGNIVLSIGIKHPFDAGDLLKPISGRNRADLHVFNVEGIVISNSTATLFDSIGESTAGSYLVNADGYTGYLDSVIDDFYPTDASIHPYITHFDDYSAGNFLASNPMGFESVTDPPPSGNLVMAMGCDYNNQDYVFDIEGQLRFIFAVGCTYAVSAASKSDRFTPEYRIPQHNKKAASEVSVEIIRNDLAAGIETSTAEIEIHIVDISHGVAVGGELNEMLADSSVLIIESDIPRFPLSPVFIVGSGSGSGHNPEDPLIYEATITNTDAVGEGIYPGLVKVTDSYSSGLNTNPLLNGMDGIKRVDPSVNPLAGLFAIDEFATYQTFEIEVSTGQLNSVGDLTVTAINRGEGGADPELITSIDIDWDDSQPGVAEYAIERGDGWDGTGWTVIDTTTNTDYKFEPSGNDWDDDIRLRVIARAVVGGNPASDSAPSYEIFLLFVSNAGHEIAGNEWVLITEGGDQGWGFIFWQLYSNTYIDSWRGENAVGYHIGPRCWGTNADTFKWSIAQCPNPVPDLEGQKEAFFDGYCRNAGVWPSTGMAHCYGTLSQPNPAESLSELTDFEPANDVYASGLPYTDSNVEGLNSEFGETDQDGYARMGWDRVGFYLNDLLDADRAYIAIGLAVGSIPVQSGYQAIGWNDGFVFVVH
jgi:hypothetical protein